MKLTIRQSSNSAFRPFRWDFLAVWITPHGKRGVNSLQVFRYTVQGLRYTDQHVVSSFINHLFAPDFYVPVHDFRLA